MKSYEEIEKRVLDLTSRDLNKLCAAICEELSGRILNHRRQEELSEAPIG